MTRASDLSSSPASVLTPVHPNSGPPKEERVAAAGTSTKAEVLAMRGEFERAGKLGDSRGRKTVKVRQAVLEATEGKKQQTAAADALAPEVTGAPDLVPIPRGHPAVEAAGKALDALASVPGIGRAGIGRIRTFLDTKLTDLSRDDLARLLQKLVAVAHCDTYRGTEKLEAMKAYLVVFAAVAHHELSPETAEILKRTFLPGLEGGTVGVRLKALSGSHAAYDTNRDAISFANRSYFELPDAFGRPASFASFPDFMMSLGTGAEPGFTGLRTRLGPEARAAINAWSKDPARSTELKDERYEQAKVALWSDLNRLLESPSLAKDLEPVLRGIKRRFGDARDAELAKLMNPSVSLDEAAVVRRNRLLLERIFPKEIAKAGESGIELESMAGRGYVIHEALHATQDAWRHTGRPIDFEYRGHRAYADYLLHATGAIHEAPEGPVVDFARFRQLTQHEGHGPPMLDGLEALPAFEVFLDAFSAHRRREFRSEPLGAADQDDLHSIMPEGMPLPAWYDPLKAVAPGEPSPLHEMIMARFIPTYLRAQMTNRGLTYQGLDQASYAADDPARAVVLEYLTAYTKDGLQNARERGPVE